MSSRWSLQRVMPLTVPVVFSRNAARPSPHASGSTSAPSSSAQYRKLEYSAVTLSTMEPNGGSGGVDAYGGMKKPAAGSPLAAVTVAVALMLASVSCASDSPAARNAAAWPTSAGHACGHTSRRKRPNSVYPRANHTLLW